MPRGHSLIPARINAHGLTDDPMMVLDAMELEAGHMLHGKLHEHHWSKEGKHHGRCRHGRRAFIAGDMPIMIAERESDLPWDDGLHP